jgi:hypothetical protein
VDLHVVTVHIALARSLEPEALIIPGSEVVRLPGLIAVVTSIHR